MTRNKAGIASPRLHEKVDEVSPQGGCNIRKAPKRQRLSNAFYSAEGALKSYETAFVPVAQMGGALSNAFFRRKYLFSVEEKYQTVPELQHAQHGIAAAHVPNQLQLRFRVLVRVAVGTPGPAGQGFHAAYSLVRHLL